MRVPSWVCRNALFQRHRFLLDLFSPLSLRNLQRLHARAVISGLSSNLFLSTRLLLAYAPLSLPDALLLLSHSPSTFSFNSLLHLSHPRLAYLLYSRMLALHVAPDSHTYPFLLRACKGRGGVMGRVVHAQAVVWGFRFDPYVGSNLVGMYLGCGCDGSSLEDAWKVFEGMSRRDVVVWTGMVSGLVGRGCAKEAVGVFKDIRRVGVECRPNEATFVSVLSACVELGSLDCTRVVHCCVVRSGLGSRLVVENSLVDAYGKCGGVGFALEVFEGMRVRDLRSWTSVVMVLALHGHGSDALDVFERMKISGFVPDSVTLVAVLSACSHAGLVDEGRREFESMQRDFGIVPEAKHYGCMVDLLSRAGLLDEAYNFIVNMPVEPNLEILGSLLSACRVHNNLQLGEIILERIRSLCEYSGGSPVLLSNMYANENQWGDVLGIRKEMRENGSKPSGRSWIEVKGVAHEFIVEGKVPNSSYSELGLILDGLGRVI